MTKKLLALILPFLFFSTAYAELPNTLTDREYRKFRETSDGLVAINAVIAPGSTINTTGNITGGYIYGNGTYLTGVNGTGGIDGSNLNASNLTIGTIPTARYTIGGDLSGTLGNLQLGASSVGATELASTAVTAGVYGNTTHIPSITVDADGRVTGVTNATAAGGSKWSDLGDGGIIRDSNVTINGTLTVGNGTSSVWEYGAAKFIFANTAGTNQLTILQTSGNVGIATTEPTTKLEVAGGTKFGDTIPLCTLTILSPDAGYTIPMKKLSIIKTYKVIRLEGNGLGSTAAGTNVIFNLRLVNDTGAHQSSLLIGSTINNAALAVTSFLGGSTIPANQRLAIDTVSESGTLPQLHLQVIGYEQ